ncbi:MAG: DUF2269 domain-containing protein [Candidatus Kapabacteria bacterium]|jgi:uncharacterized membrane protein|nr:DUF2269 domain-containing protein [Candidatus Kapabacteria bacterium]
MNIYLILKFAHILCAIIALGANITYAVWLQLAKDQPDMTVFALRGIKRIDDWVANPAYFLALATGHAMIVLTEMPMTTTWIWLGNALFILQGLLALPFYTPLLKKQIVVAETAGVDSEEFRLLERRANPLGWALTGLGVAIVVVMVWKPQ